MNERELRAKLAGLKNEYQSLKEADDTDTAALSAKVDEMAEVRSLLDTVIVGDGIELPKQKERRDNPKENEVYEMDMKDVEKRYEHVFCELLRGKNLNNEDQEVYERVIEERGRFASAVPEDGGLIIPVDVQTKINEFRRAFEQLETLVTVERVGTKSGSRVLEKLADIVPWLDIEEWDEIGEVDSPQFTQMKYAIKDYAGILPIPNTLLQDNDANLLTYVYKWIAKKSVITRNAKILEKLKTLPRTKAIATVDDLKDVFNVELDPALLGTSAVVTNQEGFNFLDKLKDADNNYILQPDPNKATGKLLFGAYPVRVIAQKFLPTESGKAPIYLGDLKESVILFDRGVYEVKATDIGGKAFTRNTTDIRVIDRFDVQLWDDQASIVGAITVPATQTLSAKSK